MACKLIRKSTLTEARTKQKLVSEIKIHRQLKHPNVCMISNFFDDDNCIYIMLELCPNETLLEVLQRRKRLHEIEV